nr:TPA_exp: polyketide synthase [Kiritimatiellota bacterium]
MKIDKEEVYNNKDIAVIGMSCRFPGATDYLSYWDNLLKGKNHIIPIPENRWDRNAYQSTDRRDKNKMMGQYGGLIDDPEYFDHQLFGLSPEEARQTDPQHRLLLEQTWHALEDTGISFQSFSERKTAVFVGIMASDYLQLSSSYNQDINQYASIGNYSSIAANRISHTFKFRGISKTIDTACSSSLVAIHDAVCALRNKTCDYVVVGGANLILHPWKSISFSKARMLSEDGRCKTFDCAANGYVAGEGAAVIVLERAQESIKEHHSIHGIIKSATVNHVDQSAHISAPSVKAQSSLIQKAIREAGIDKDTISYVEAHGTGTSLGDPIEVEALSRVFNQKSRRSPLYIGSVKTNIGHLEAAAGLAGVIKVLLMMKYKWMPQSLNITEQNPLLNVGRHIQVVREKKQWISGSSLYRAGVSSFGFGGSNAHIILEESNATVQALSKYRPSYYPLLLSAASKTSLNSLKTKVVDQYQRDSKSSWRIAKQCSNKPSLLKRLGGYIDGDQRLAFMTPNTIGQSNNRLFFSKVMAGICRADIETQCAYLTPYIQHYASQLSDKVKENQILDTCIVMLALADFLVDQGYRVNEVCAEGTGCLAALVWVDILSFQDLLVYLADDTHELKFKRPSKTILLYNRKIRPYPFQAEDIKHLLHHAKITQVECLSIIKKSVLLLKNQQTFRRHIDEWRPLLKQAGFLDPESLLKLPIDSNSIDYHYKEIFVGTLIFLSSIMKVQSKWDLQGISENKQEEMRTLIRLLSCDALDKQSLLKCVSSSVCEGDNTLFHFDKMDTYFESYEQSSDVGLVSDAFDIDHLLHQKHTRDKSADTHVCWMGDCLEKDVDPSSRLCIEGHALDRELKKVLLQLWTNGHPIKWRWLLGDILCEKNEPILYPFDRKYFWGKFKTEELSMDTKPDPVNHENQSVFIPEAAGTLSTDMNRYMESKIEYLSPVWQRIDPPSNQEIVSNKLALIIEDKEGLSDQLQHALKEKGTPVSTIPSTLDEEELQQVMANIKKKQTIGHESLIIYFLASYTTKPQDNYIIREAVYLPLFLLSKVIMQTKGVGDISLMAVTCNSQRVDDKDRVNGYAYGAVDGLLSVVAEECNIITPLYLDLIEMDIESSVAAILQTGNGICRKVSCRNRSYYKNELVPTLQSNKYTSSLPNFYEQNGTYILVGGLGRLGFEVACDLAKSVDHPTLILMGRSKLTENKKKQIESLTDQGARVIYYQVDISEKYRVDAVFEDINETFTSIRAVLFLAGQYQPQLIINKKASDFVKNTTSKIIGSENVFKASVEKGFDLNYFLLFSSVTSTYAFSGTSDYALSNSFIDGMYNHLMGTGNNTIYKCINWGNWTIGMASDSNTKSYLEEKGFVNLSVEEGLESFKKIMTNTVSHVVVCKKKRHETDKRVHVYHTENDRSDKNGGDQDIAVIGISGKFPEASDVHEFWDNLCAAKDCLRTIPPERFNVDDYYDPEIGKEGKLYCTKGGFVKDIDQFDPLFFNISPREAKNMDPQYRLLLQEMWRSLEDSGYPAREFDNRKVGVFIGGWSGDYPGHTYMPSTNSARLSYLFNWRGPCICYETTCSSALVALTEACNSLRNNTCEVSIVGGVNLMITPHSYLPFCSLRAASPSGRCFSFDHRADGTVFTEAIASIVLKPLKQASIDGDHIYGVIKGYGLNYDGTSNGITAPSVSAQFDLETEVYKNAEINPEDITMVEAHGTGTQLGDPVEVSALKQSFGTFTKKTGYCALGSVKSNIGHTGATAGLSGLMKVLLSLKHKKIPPTINFETINPSIKLENSPFYINTTLKNWDMPEGKSRMACVSSFGFTGTNAHVVIEEYPMASEKEAEGISLNGKSDYGEPALIVLSARNEERLKEYAKKLYDFNLYSSPFTFQSVAYTLQVGREAMEKRLAFVVKDKEELKKQLEEYLEGKKGGWIKGNINNVKDSVSLVLDGKEGELFLKTVVEEKNWKKLGQLWVSGIEIDWKLLYGKHKHKRVSLPTYPFSRESYWVDSKVEGAGQKIEAIKRLHPLVHENTSTLEEQRFSSTFTGEEFFLKNHVVKSPKVFPGVVYLEMAREAIEQAVGGFSKEDHRIELKNVVWSCPIGVGDHPARVHIRLFVEENGEINYGIYTDNPNEEEGLLVHSQGEGVLTTSSEQLPLDIEGLEQRLKGKSLSAQECYEAFKVMGIVYGPAYQGVEDVYVGEDEVLAKLSLPSEVSGSEDDFILHPSMLDSALQASVGMQLGKKEGSGVSVPLSLPFALERLEIITRCAKSMWAYIRFCEDSSKTNGHAIRKLDIDICDERGNVCVKLKGLSLRVLGGGSQSRTSSGLLELPLAERVPGVFPNLANKLLPVTLRALSQEEGFSVKESVAVKPKERITLKEEKPKVSASTKEIELTVPQEAFFSKERLSKELIASLSEALYLKPDSIDINKPFMDMGLDSIVGVEWIQSLKKQYGLSLGVTNVYDYPNIVEFTKFLEKELNSQKKSFRSSPSKPKEPKVSLPEKTPSSEPAFTFPEQVPVKEWRSTRGISPIVTKEKESKVSASTKEIELTVPQEAFFSKERLSKELIASLSEALYLKPDSIDINKPFMDMGLDSIVGVEWIQSLKKQYGLSLGVTNVYDYPNIVEFTKFLEKELNSQKKSFRSSPSKPKEPKVSLPEKTPSSEPAFTFPEQVPVKEWRSTRGISPAVTPGTEKMKGNPCSVGQEGIAIVGMSGRYPGACDLREYWKNLSKGENSIREIPPSRWDVNEYYDPDRSKKGKIYCKWLGMLDDIDCFDPLFFMIPPVEAEGMDPQHRLFLEEGYKAFEDGGYNKGVLSNKKCGVYLGIMSNEYGMLELSNEVGISVTSNSFAIGAARIPYYLNLKGPAIPIDTACSSSLVGIHLACQALRHNEIDMALAGGVSLYLTVECYLAMCSAGMLSASGQCKTFDDRADGFVPGEGVGAVVLKRLSDAERDRDNILGVIIGSGINQDGRTNGIMAPSVNSQIELEREVYERYKIDPSSISYVETHGTGTKLGDPIELEALSTVFREKTEEKNYCGLGSVKSNLGHTSAAAGVASIQKMLLCLKERQLVPTLNYKKPNSHFDFENSPFYVNTDLRAWDSGESPRRCAISSFGFSGTNAHVILEEYVGKELGVRKHPSLPSLAGLSRTWESESENDPGEPLMIVLSAKDEDRLKEYAQKLHDFTLHPSLFTLKDLAYTLQVGREAMEERLGLIVRSVEDLKKKLEGFINGKEDMEELYRGQERLLEYAVDEDMAKTIEAWVVKKKYSKLLDLWVKGLAFDWAKLYGEEKPQRISAPTYPFAKESYWVERPKASFFVPLGDREGTKAEGKSRFHPLVHENRSTFEEQRFNSTFSGEEFFLKDHVVNGQRMLPAVAYLEMIRESVEQTMGNFSDSKKNQSIELKNVAWSRPIAVGDMPVEVHIGLYQEENGEIAYEIYTTHPSDEKSTIHNPDSAISSIVHSQGVALFTSADPHPQLDLKALEASCNQRHLSAEQSYEAFKRMGFEYGPAYQGLKKLYVGEDEVLAQLMIPSCVLETKDQYMLHPSLIDAVLQASILLPASRESRTLNPELKVPFGLERLEIIHSCKESMWVWIRCSEDSAAADIQKLDLDLCDEEGKVCVKIKGLEMSPVEIKEIEQAPEEPTGKRSVHYLEKQWEASFQTPNKERQGTILLLTTEETEALATLVAQAFSQKAHRVKIHQLNQALSRTEKLGEAYDGLVDLVGCGKVRNESLDWIGCVQQLIENGAKEGLTCLGITKGLESYRNASMNLTGATRAGLYRMLQSEYTHVRSRHVDLDSSVNDKELAQQIAAEFFMDGEDAEVCYRSRQRYRATLSELLSNAKPVKKIVFPEDHVLWVTGGTRGLGSLCAHHFVQHYGVKRLVLTGREAFPPQAQWSAYAGKEDAVSKKIRAIEYLQSLGAEVRILSTDLTGREAVQKDVQEITASLGPAGGVIHCAGMGDLDNPAFIRKSIEGIQRVLDPKVSGLDILLSQFHKEPLEFFMLFSSVSAIVPTLSSGQSDYAMANTYMDYAAQARSHGFPLISIQWPSWRETGMGEAKSMAYRQTGLLSHSNEEGLKLLDQILSENMGPVVLPAVVNPTLWKPEKLLKRRIEDGNVLPATVSEVVPKTDQPKASGALFKPIENWLKEVFSKELKIDQEKLESDTPFSDYGVDSILLAQVARRMDEKLADPLDPSVLFEHSTLNKLTSWLVQAHWNSLSTAFGVEGETRVKVEASTLNAFSGRTLPGLVRKSRRAITKTEDIVVVGLSCRFPGSTNVEEYWDLLSEGRSAIVPVPEERFKGSDLFYAGLINSITDFDPSFFLIAQEDAKAMDPQAFLVLEESLNVFHHAGYSLKDIKGLSTGVYLGGRSQNLPEESDLEESRNPIMAVGQNYLAANISQFFDFRGPSLVVDTACSSALVGMNLAIKDLVAGEIESALVGGVSLLTGDGAHKIFQRRKLLNTDGMFHIFDQRASGVVLGEGVGFVLLKTLDQAQKDGDHIYARIKGLSINNDGRTAGPATPNIEAQKEVMKLALKKSGKKAEGITYIDVNGSGSEVTDLLELKAIESVYRSESKDVCRLGSMKPNIGHPLCAEGMASFIKLVLMLNHRQWVPFLSAQEKMVHYDLEHSPFIFDREKSAWSEDFHTVALNCFADGGTNAHVILEGGERLSSESAKRANRRKPLPPPELNRVHIGKAFSKEPSEQKRFFLSETDRGLFTQPHPWSQTFDQNHSIFKNHLAYGQTLLPGLAYIDLLYQFFRARGYDYRELELRNLSIYQPLIVGPDYGVRLFVQSIEERQGEIWKISVEGQEFGSQSESKSYVTAEMRRRDPKTFEDSIDVSSIFSSSVREVLLSDLYKRCREYELVHTGFMRAEGTVYSLESADWIKVSVPEAGLDQADHFMFHPTLIDGSGVGAGGLFSSIMKDEKRLFLPLFYESFRATELLQKNSLTRIVKSSVKQKGELLSLDMEFFNESGQKVAALKNFVNKLVREAGLINPGRAKKQPVQIKQSPPSSNVHRPQPRSVSKLKAPISPSSNGASDLDMSYVQKAEGLLKRTLASKLKTSAEAINTESGYYEMGLDSSMLLEVVKELEGHLSISLGPTLLFEYTTVKELSAYLAQTYGEDVQGVSTETAPEGTDLQHQEVKPPMVESFTSPVEENWSAPVMQDDIAVIGLSGKYPGARNVDEFWQNLKAGKDCITEIPQERWDWRILDDLQSPSGKKMSRWGGFIDHPDYFDPEFFNISPHEAEAMDPQERLFLQICWEAIEDAGYRPADLTPLRGRSRRRDVAVFVGAMHKDYTMIGAEVVSRGAPMPLSLNYATIANRVSYFCNFHGPSMAIDTVCSSSLNAVHLAMESLHRGESLVALAGGVNLSLHPNKYMTYGMWDLHSSDGYCHTFGEGGDGYVSGEGIGAVLLKPLKQAVKDGDHIYAVIKGSAVNHVGKVSGMSVPSPVAQGEMIERCFEQSGIDPRTISYMEAHGTGTSLGDPIEIQGLVRAFGKFTQDKQFCSIGSVKSNIGHAESAAGISGLTKVILQLNHKTLVPSLHSETVNPHLNMEDTPFYIQDKTEKWSQPAIKEHEGEPAILRRAGVSSFGATGSNAHVILEEYVKEEAPIMEELIEKKWVIVPLSAKNPEQLKEAANNLHAYLRSTIENPESSVASGSLCGGNIQDLAYTLQVGREAMQERIAFLIKDEEELSEKLRNFINGEEIGEHFWQGQVKDGEKATIFFTPEDMQEMVNQWVVQGKLRKIANVWVQGLNVGWEAFYHNEKRPQRMSLPTYPFAKKRYWIETEGKISNIEGKALHPLVHENTSDFEEQRFSSIFTGEEFFLRDHQVKGEKVLSGVAYLEMVREAVEQTAGKLSLNHQKIELKDVVWARPIAVNGQPQQVNIGLFPKENGEILYEIYSEPEKNNSDDKHSTTMVSRQQLGDEIDSRSVHSQGVALFASAGQRPQLDLKALQASCIQSHLSADECYEAFKAIGIEYGPAHKGLEKLYVGEDEVLAALTLPASILETKDQFTLHPSLLDSALQAAIGLDLPNRKPRTLNPEPKSPFTLERVEILDRCSASMWAWMRCSKDRALSDTMQKWDMDLCDEMGKVCISFRGLSYGIENSTPVKTETRVHWRFSLPTDKKENGRSSSHFSVEKKAALFVRQIVADQLQKPIDQVDVKRGYFDMGLTSLGLVKMDQGIKRKIDKEFEPTLLFEYSTVSELSAYLCSHYPVELAQLVVTKETVEEKVSDRESMDLGPSLMPLSKRRYLSAEKKTPPLFPLSPDLQSRFPELVPLNESSQGRPVFWFHAGLGGAQPYHEIAQKSVRPFYGIQARGFQTERSPLLGVQAMAAYYVHIIQKVQPEGPYDLGGYSFGGTLAYEVTRQLQEGGAEINTVVMLDAFDHAPMSISPKTDMLSGVNYLLSLRAMDPKKTDEVLIHRDELDSDLNDETFLTRLIILAKKRGLTQTKKEIQESIKKMARVQRAYELDRFTIEPLTAPKEISCYYFRNKSGLFFGEHEPYYTAMEGEVQLDHINYWSEWKKQIPKFHIMDVDCSNHMMLLSEPKVHETILDFCQTLYSAEGMRPQFLTSFKRKTEREHGILFLKRPDPKNEKKNGA